MTSLLERAPIETGHDRLTGLDFQRHNAEVREMWAAYRAGKPYRTPVILGLNTRYFMRDPAANSREISFREYTQDPDMMFEAQLAFQRWTRFNVLQDAELGLPDVWRIGIDFQNYYEAAWFGCPVAYYGGQVPDAEPAFADQPERVMERGLPDPFSGIMSRGLDYYDHFVRRAWNEDYLGLPIDILPPWFGTGSDGPMTVACSLFGPEFVCTAMAAESERLHALLDFITEATIRRMTAWRMLAGIRVPIDDFMMADDSIALISNNMYREHILPYHRRIYDKFGTRKGRGIHLCGDSTRHFATLHQELGIDTFDTGFPVDFGRLRLALGPDVRIQGGPNVELMRSGTPAQIWEETRRIMRSGVLDGGMFVLREGNNLAPGTPLENTEALYHAGRRYGRIGAYHE